MDVTVAIITYNHANYIAQAIESVLPQEVDFEYELLIGDDGSDDGTSDIVREYESRYPDKIRAFYHDRSKVIYVKGRPTAKYNYLNNLRHARGKYVALLDGDDYWTSNNKLQVQRDILEQDRQCSICFHPVEIVASDGTHLNIAYPPRKKSFYDIYDLIPDNFVHTSSVVFRHDREFVFPDWFYQISFGDWAQHLMRATGGNLAYVDEVMSAYRIHGQGRWSNYKSVQKIRESIEVLEFFNQHTNKLHDDQIQTAIQRMDFNLILKYLDAGEHDNARKHLKKLTEQLGNKRRISTLDYLYIRLCTYFPLVNRLLTGPLKASRKFIT